MPAPGSGGAAGGAGSLIFGAHDDSGVLRYIGNIGTGMTDRQRRELRDKLIELERSISPFAVEPPRAVTRNASWSRPVLVCDVEYREYTGGSLRHSSFEDCGTTRSPMKLTFPDAINSLSRRGGCCQGRCHHRSRT
ncbi:hypothetical protein [Rhodococcus erythropolis]|uniref:ATP dependent DNA ligase n=1 Tax=Rhodococcus erythropolis TaxID=1833 RepID=UPI00210EC641|nr:hypothetical protein [Rhodococcus erythropolis]